MEEEEDEYSVVGTNHFFTEVGMPMFLTEDEEYTGILDIPNDEDYFLENDDVLENESDGYPCGYMNALSAQQRKYSLRI